MMGLGIIDTDLCLWAKAATPAMVEEAFFVPGHPVVKAKPAPIEGLYAPEGAGGVVCDINRWVTDHPVLAVAAVVGGWWLLRK